MFYEILVVSLYSNSSGAFYLVFSTQINLVVCFVLLSGLFFLSYLQLLAQKSVSHLSSLQPDT